MGVGFWFILIAGFAGLAVFAGLILAIVLMSIRGFANKGGMNDLAVQYPAVQEPANALRRQTVKIGAFQYQRCLTVAVVDAGLYLSVRTVFTAPKSALIPWSQIRLIGAGRLYWRPTHCISIGNPQIVTIEVFEDLWRQIEPRLA
jgi:hypothetical protein